MGFLLAALLLFQFDESIFYTDEFYAQRACVAHTFKEDLETIVVLQYENTTNYYYFRKLATGEVVCVDCTYENYTPNKWWHFFHIRLHEKDDGATLTFYDNYPGIYREVTCKHITWVLSDKYFYIPIEGIGLGLKQPPPELIWDDEEIVKLMEKNGLLPFLPELGD